MKERPILFSAPMVRAILSGQKTQTRRVVKPQPERTKDGVLMWGASRRGMRFGVEGMDVPPGVLVRCPYGQPGDRLWVREAFMHEPADYCWEASVSVPCRPAVTNYRADFPNSQPGEGWKPSIHMPRALSRITLEITGVRIQRLQDISETDARAEGVRQMRDDSGCWVGREGPGRFVTPWPTAGEAFCDLWRSINGADSWGANPWVWAIEFRRI